MPYKDPKKRREYARGYYSSEDQKQKKRVCDYCGSLKDLVIHHINGDHKDNNANNLKCLCASCHSKLHIKKRIRSATGQVEPVAIKIKGGNETCRTTIHLCREL